MFFCFRYVFIESYLIMFCVYFTCRVYKENFLLSCKEIGRLPPTFADASAVAQEILDSGFEYDNGTLYFNKFKYVLSTKHTCAICCLSWAYARGLLNMGLRKFFL